MLVAVTPPSRETEALRDALRAREDVVHAQRRARQQLSGFLLRQDRNWSKKTAWTQRHLLWIRAQRFESEIQQQVLEDYVAEVHRLTDRLAEATERVERYAVESVACGALFRALQALRGVGPIVAATVVAEIGDLKRLPYMRYPTREYRTGTAAKRSGAGRPRTHLSKPKGVEPRVPLDR